MNQTNKSFQYCFCVFALSVLTLLGCAKEEDGLPNDRPVERHVSESTGQTQEAFIEKIEKTEQAADKVQEESEEVMITEVDWSDFFEGINGAAVIYNPVSKGYHIYNQELADTRRSPCSTFKIISSLIALENGVIEPEHSVRKWSGEIFWNENWNTDIDFYNAFHDSCVWYFREVVDEIGKDVMQDELNKLQYGNCDISDWSGRLNTNNSNPALTGFWLESSLMISPKEQTEVMERIFGDNTTYSEASRNQLKQVMLLSEYHNPDVLIYGKTGMGKSDGVVVDAWFTGFADTNDKRVYFCVYLGETEHEEVSSTKAREIAIKIISAL